VALAEGCRQQADEELAALTTLKRKHTGNAGEPRTWRAYVIVLHAAQFPHVRITNRSFGTEASCFVGSGHDARVHAIWNWTGIKGFGLQAVCLSLWTAAAVFQPWDQEFYTRQLSSSQPHIKATSAAAPYLQLGSVLQGLSQLLQQLMGLSLQLQPLQPGEGWAPGVLKLSVTCEEQGPLGVLYLDMLTRESKPAASGILYPLRCGRELPGKGAGQQAKAAGCAGVVYGKSRLLRRRLVGVVCVFQDASP